MQLSRIGGESKNAYDKFERLFSRSQQKHENLKVNTSFFVGNYFSIPLPSPTLPHLAAHSRLCFQNTGRVKAGLRLARTWGHGFFGTNGLQPNGLEDFLWHVVRRPRPGLVSLDLSFAKLFVSEKPVSVYLYHQLQKWAYQPRSPLLFGAPKKDPRNLAQPQFLQRGDFPTIFPAYDHLFSTIVILSQVCREPNP